MRCFIRARLLLLSCLVIWILPGVRAEEDASARYVRAHDQNGDGKLSEQELPEQFRRGFSRMDLDGDGLVTVEEHRQIRAAAATQQEEAASQAERLVRARDKDGDGKLTGDELSDSLKRLLDKADRDGDGSLSTEEVTQLRLQQLRRKAMLETRAERMKPPVPPTFQDVAYGDDPKQRFDLWAVKGNTAAPLAIYIHGGGFRAGDKSAVNGPLVKALLARGIAFASMNYRLTDQGPYPMPMLDCARGLQTIRNRAAELGIDPDRIGLLGGSAGSGISQWLAFHDDLAEPGSADPVARQSTRVRCAAPFSAQTTYDPRVIAKLFDSDQVHEALPAFYGAASIDDVANPRLFPLYEDASPINHLTKDDPPIFLYYSQPNDPLPKNSAPSRYIHHPKFGFLLKEKMDALGIECTLLLHEQSPGFPVEEMAAFFERHLGKAR